MTKIITVIKCETEGELLAVLSKIESETNAKWNSGVKPTKYYPETTRYPIYLLIYFYSEEIDITYSTDTIDMIRKQHKEDMVCELDAKDYLSSSSENEKTLSINDPVQHPFHYTQDKVECIDAMEQVFGKEAVIDFCMCNVFKYLWRRKDKDNEEQDTQKAIRYFDMAKELINR